MLVCFELISMLSACIDTESYSTNVFYLVSLISVLNYFLSLDILLELEQVDQDPDFIALSRQFKATAMELISVLEQVIFLL
jgi:hypothetical protein